MAFLDGLIAPDEQDLGPSSLYPWMKRGTPPMFPRDYPPPTAQPMPAGRPSVPRSPLPESPAIGPSVIPGSPLAAVPVGPSASTTPPAVPNAPLQPVTLGGPAQPPPPKTELHGAKKVLDVLGQYYMPRLEELIPGSPGYQRREAAQQQKTTATDLANREAEANIARTGAETAKLTAEANPKPEKPEDLKIVYADAVQEAIAAGRDPRTDPQVQQIADTITALQREPNAPKPTLEESIIEAQIGKQPDRKSYQPGPGGDAAYTAAAQSWGKAAQAIRQQKPPENPPRTLLEVPQADGTSKIIEATPGMTVPAGARTPTQAGNINQMEQTRADMAENVNENLSQLEDIVKRRPDLFGKVMGRATKFREWIGTNDQDIAAMQQIEDNLGRAMTSAHGMRNGQLVEKATRGILNSYKNGPDAVRSAINEARNSVKTFTADVESKGGKTGAQAAPARPKGVPAEAIWNEAQRQWQLPQTK